MMKKYRHIISVLTALCVLVSLSLSAFAAGDEPEQAKLIVGGTTVDRIRVTADSDDGLVITNTDGYQIKVEDEESSTGSGCNTKTIYKARTRTVTFTNTHGGVITITPYTINEDGSLIKLEAGTNCEIADGVITMQPTGYFTITVTSSTNTAETEATTRGNNTAIFKPTGIDVEAVSAEIKFENLKPEQGSFTVTPKDGETFDAPGSATSSKFDLTATAASGYQIYRWVFTSVSSGEKTYFGLKDPAPTYEVSEAGTITCQFMPTDAATYEVNAAQYNFLDEAIAAAESGSDKKIVLTASGTVYSSTGNNEITIPNGVTLVLPYTARQSTVTTAGTSGQFPYANYTQNCENNKYATQPTALDTSRTFWLTIPSGTIVKNNGIIAVGGTLHGNAALNGTHSNLKIEKDGVLELKSSTSILSAIGYVYGEGSVVANGSGAKIYQPFSLLRVGSSSWHVGAVGRAMGGSSMGMQTWPDDGYSGTNPSPRYATQAIQCTLKMEYGDYMYGYSEQHAYNIHYMGTVMLIGKDTDTTKQIGLKKGASLTSTYSSNKYSNKYSNVGKLTLTIDGGAEQGTLSLTLQGRTIALENWPFPVPYNYDIVLVNGDYDLDYDLSLLPGAGLTVGEKATLNVNKSLAVFAGANDHSQYGRSGQSAAVTISYGGGKDGAVYPLNSTLTNFVAPDGKTASTMANLVVNGTMNVNGSFGGIVQTTGNTGKVVMAESASKDSLTRQLGLTGQAQESSYGSKYDFVGATIYAFTPQYFDTDGVPQTMAAGETYHAANTDTNKVANYTFDFYPNSRDFTKANGGKVNKTETITATAVGQWKELRVAQIGNVGYATLADAVAAYTGTGYIQMLTGTTETTVGDANNKKTIYLDLNGQNVNVTTFNVDTLYGMDTATNGYLADGATPGKIIGTISGNIALVTSHDPDGVPTSSVDDSIAPKHYVKVDQGNNTYSFQRVGIGVTGMQYIDTDSDNYLVFQAQFRGPVNPTDMGFEVNNETSWHNLTEDVADVSFTDQSKASYGISITGTDPISVRALLGYDYDTDKGTYAGIAQSKLINNILGLLEGASS